MLEQLAPVEPVAEHSPVFLLNRPVQVQGVQANISHVEDEEVRAVDNVKAAEETLPPNRLTVELGSVVDCRVQSLVYWNMVVVHLNNPATRHALAQICHCMENFASTFSRVEHPR